MLQKASSNQIPNIASYQLPIHLTSNVIYSPSTASLGRQFNTHIYRKQGGKPYTIPDPPPPLPTWRLEDSPPSTVAGVDFARPLYVKTVSIENKVYVCLSICANTPTMHLEVVDDLSKGTFLKAFRGFVSHRSLPWKMVSDNATTYLSAVEE